MSNSKQMRYLRQRWGQWSRLVRAVQSRRKFTMSGRRYADLYQELLDACEDKESSESTGLRLPSRLNRRIRKLVEPWASLETLSRTDRRIIQDLLIQIREIDGVMHPKAMHLPRPLRYLLVASLLAIVVGGGAYLLAPETFFEEGFVSMLARTKRRVEFSIGRMSVTSWLTVVGAGVVLFVVLLTRGIRKF